MSRLRSIAAAFSRDGAPLVILAVVALLAVVAILVGVNTRSSHEIKGYAEFSVTTTGCAIEKQRSLNAKRCIVLGNGNYVLQFSKSLESSTPIVSRSACCPGTAAATIRANGDVLVYLGRFKQREVRAALILP